MYVFTNALRDRFKKTARGAVNLFGKLLTLVI